MIRLGVDANVFLYALGQESPWRDECRELVGVLDGDDVLAEVPVAVLQEVLHVRARRTGDRAGAVAVVRDLGVVVTPLAQHRDDLGRALDLFHAHQGLDAADAFHAAVWLRAGTETVVSLDAGFDGVPGLARVRPSQVLDRLHESARPGGL